MPGVDKKALEDKLEALAREPGATREDCAAMWADAVVTYFKFVVPVSTTVSAGSSVLAGALATAFAAKTVDDLALKMEQAFAAYAITLGGGMMPLYTGVKPPGAVGFRPLFDKYPKTHAVAAAAMASVIDTWARTGKATLIAPPGAPFSWS